MSLNKKIGIGVIAIIVIAVGSYFNSQNISTPTQITSTNKIDYHTGSASSCALGAQDYTNLLNKSALEVSHSTNRPGSVYFIESSHYVTSKNICYFELHNQLQLPGLQQVVSTHTIYMLSGLSKTMRASNLFTPATEVADCSTQNADTATTVCNYYYPIKILGSGNFTYWVDQYGSDNAAPISQKDFQSLLQKYMTAN